MFLLNVLLFCAFFFSSLHTSLLYTVHVGLFRYDPKRVLFMLNTSPETALL